MTAKFADDPAHWQNRAEEIRALTDEMKDEASRQIMRRIAEDYDRLAHFALQRLKGKSKE